MLKHNAKYEILTDTGWSDFSGVLNNGLSETITVSTFDRNLRCTKDHNIFVDGFISKEAQKLELDDHIITKSGLCCVEKVELGQKEDVFDIIGVEKNNRFYANDILVSNCDEFWTANYPAITASKESKLIIISTPKGQFNLFGRLWSDSIVKRNEFKHSKVTWKDVPGRDEKWKEDQLRNMNYDMVKFAQEFEGEFVGSISTVIDPEILKQISNKYIQPVTKDLNGKLAVYEKPIDGCVYVIGADTAKGTGEHYSSTQILKVISLKPIKLKQVAVFNDNMVDVYKYAEILNRLGVYFNGAWIICENNAEGSAVVNQLWWELEYSKLYNCGSKTTDLGIRATRNTKPKAVLLMKKLIEDYSLELVDRDTLEQLNDYSEKNGKFACNNLNDDLVSALYWATYALTLDILDESFEFDKKEEEDDVWGILTDSADLTDWTWLETPSII